MRLDELRLRHDLADALGHAVEILDARHDAEDLPAAEALALDRLADHHRVERHDEGAHGEAIDRRRRDDGHLAHAGERQLQRARDRRRGQRQHVHVGFELLQLLLVRRRRNAAPRPRPAGRDRGIRRPSRAAHACRRRCSPCRPPGPSWSRRPPSRSPCGSIAGPRPAGPAKRAEKLRKCWRASSVVGTTTATCAPDIAATKAARSATSVLPKPTSPQISRSIGRPEAMSSSTSAMARDWSSVSAKGKRAQNSSQLPSAGRHGLGLLHPARGGDADELARHVADALLGARLARLPARAAELVERDAGALAAEAREHLDVLDRQEELVVAVIEQAQAVMRRAADGERDEPVIAADAVILVHDQIAFGDFRGLGDELVRALAPARRAGDALAEQVLLADDRDVLGDEAAFEAERDEHGRGSAAACATAAQSSACSARNPFSCRRCAMRSREPRVQAAMTVRRFSPAQRSAWARNCWKALPAWRAGLGEDRRPGGRRHRSPRRPPACRRG